MKKNILALAVAAVAFNANAGTVKTDGEDLVISTKGGLKVKTESNSASFQLGGRIQWDFDQTEVDGGNANSDTDIRRARIFAKGHVGDWGYKAQFNVGGDDPGSVEDLYIRYTGWGKGANLTIGKQKEPFGLEEQTSSKDISVLERSAITESHAFGRNVGVQLHGKSGNFTYGIGVFEDGEGKDESGDVALTSRFTFAPVKTDDSVVHLGLGFSERSADYSAYNLEFAAAMGSFHFQAEQFETELADMDVDGFYMQAGWILTGEQRPYKDGVFKRVKPSKDSGAWELVARYEDGFGKYSDAGLATVEGEQLSLGINYYPNDNVRLGLSWMTAEEDGSGLEGDELRARVQFVY